MPDTNGRRKESETQAAAGPPDPELESLIAPQGYSAELVDEIAEMETPTEQRNKAIRYGIFFLIVLALVFWWCKPTNVILPDNLSTPAPYGIDHRSTPPADKFLRDAIPHSVGNFTRVDLQEKQIFEPPFIGGRLVEATYQDSAGAVVTVVMIKASSYIDARRYLENYKAMLSKHKLTEWEERLYIEHNYIQWAASDLDDWAYGLAWNTERYLVAVTSSDRAALHALAAEFPY